MVRLSIWVGFGLLVVGLSTFGCASSEETPSEPAEKAEDMNPIPPEPDPELAAAGEKLFSEFNCKACHQVTGGDEAARGPEDGPDLHGIGLKRTQAWLRSHILNPRPHTVDSPMPGFAVNEDQLDAVVAYLQSLR